jgi:hypothetical protein
MPSTRSTVVPVQPLFEFQEKLVSVSSGETHEAPQALCSQMKRNNSSRANSALSVWHHGADIQRADEPTRN